VNHSYYRTQVGRLLFLTALRPDMQFAVSQLSRRCSAPTCSDDAALRRCIRYLHGTREFVLRLRPSGPLALEAYADADWAGNADRRSVSGGLLLLAGAPVLSWSRTQSTRALSSCEAELYSMGSAVAEVMWLASLLSEICPKLLARRTPLVYCDSTSSMQVGSRPGTGRLKPIEVRLLALQDWHREGRIRYQNPADLLTKHVPTRRLEELRPLLSVGP
jgi:hypothetical protein